MMLLNGVYFGVVEAYAATKIAETFTIQANPQIRIIKMTEPERQ